MPKPLEVEQPASPGQKPPAHAANITAQVLRLLGRPVDLYAVQVRHLWQDHYRVNVLVGLNAADVKVAHSYFLILDGDGKLGSCEPQITGRYAPGAVAVA